MREPGDDSHALRERPGFGDYLDSASEWWLVFGGLSCGLALFDESVYSSAVVRTVAYATFVVAAVVRVVCITRRRRARTD